MPKLSGPIKPKDTNLASLTGICDHLGQDPRLGPVVEAIRRLAREQDEMNKDAFAGISTAIDLDYDLRDVEQLAENADLLAWMGLC